jgi:hypothetical protein
MDPTLYSSSHELELKKEKRKPTPVSKLRSNSVSNSKQEPNGNLDDAFILQIQKKSSANICWN